MSNLLKMSCFIPKSSYERITGSFLGIDNRRDAPKDSLVSVLNVNAAQLPRLVGNGTFSDRSITTSGAAYQIRMFALKDKMYVFGFDGSRIHLYALNSDGSVVLVYSFSEEMTLETAKQAVSAVVLCGMNYGNNRGRRVLFYPLGYEATVVEETGALTDFVDLKQFSDFNSITHAVLYKDRIFATDGMDLYASRVESVTEFLPKVGYEDNEEYPWKGSVAHDGRYAKPIVCLQVYNGRLYYFCRNSFGEVRGTGNPYRCEQLYDVGTDSAKSVQVLDGKLYFLCQSALMCYDGNEVVCVSDALQANFVSAGMGAVWNGMYTFAAIQDDAVRLYSYCPQNGQWGNHRAIVGSPIDLCTGANGLHLLTYSEGRCHVSLLGEQPGGFSCQTVFFEPVPNGVCHLMQVRINMTLQAQDTATVMLMAMRSDGSYLYFPLFSDEKAEGEVILQKKICGIAGRKFALAFNVRGSATVHSYEIVYRREDDGYGV